MNMNSNEENVERQPENDSKSGKEDQRPKSPFTASSSKASVVTSCNVRRVDEV